MLARLIRPSILLQRELQPAIPILANDRHLHTSIVRLSSKNNKAGNNHAESASVKDIKQPFTEKRRKDEISPEARSSVGRQSPTVMDMFSMKGKSVAITGAARGLGNLFARAVVESGCTSLAILDLKENEANRAAKEMQQWFETEGEIKKGTLDIIGVGCDVSNETSVQEAFKQVVDKFGKIDSMVASAGIVENFPAFDYPTEKIRKLYDINVHGSFFCAREAAKWMVEKKVQGGSIVLVASMSANIVNIPQPQTPYNGSKAAVKHMAASLGVEWAPHNIRVNALSPGYMLTALTRAVMEKDQELKRKWESLTPMGRMGEPEDLKGAIIYLASDASKFTTGTELRVDGGYTVV